MHCGEKNTHVLVLTWSTVKYYMSPTKVYKNVKAYIMQRAEVSTQNNDITSNGLLEYRT